MNQHQTHGIRSQQSRKELCNEDIAVAYVDLKGRGALKVIVCSAYLPGEKQDPTEELTKVLEYAQAQKAELIVGCDANAHHTIWGSTGINKRGELLSQFIFTNCLHLLNNGNTPTFVTRARQEVLDITFATEKAANCLANWRVSSENSMSDHRHILFSVKGSIDTVPLMRRNPKDTSWEAYKADLETSLKDVPKYVKTPDSLNMAVNQISKGMIRAYELNCPVKESTCNRKTTWWNKN
ncbi:uncharacterized protein LOC125233587 [Leguminivora glycinivorella]|uniref:uncharacterized protein LOC125233587 n=1 Tax=Leguminivora glycinivorella TaxID=1035111 RepID=UPI0020103ED1|nr:uncharacterized protein LOC125233587 [Leguminivora glycinivorella]